jgi:hypothetical protein
VARRVRGEWPELPILLTTGYSQNAENVGRAFLILPKPYALPDMSLALASLLDGAARPGEPVWAPTSPEA